MSLLLGLPVDREEFVQRVSESDWLAKFHDPDLGPEEQNAAIATRWESEYLPFVAGPLERLIEVAKGFGVQVKQRATIEDLSEATRTNEIVIIFAHWKGSEFVNDDFTQSVEAGIFLKRIGKPKTPLQKWLANRFSEEELGSTARPKTFASRIARTFGFSKENGKGPRDILSEALGNVALNSPAREDGIDGVVEHEETRKARRREELDLLFEGLVRPGNRLELYDGMHSKEKVGAALAVDFRGILDLTICTSMVLGDFIAARGKHMFRTVQFPTLQEVLWGTTCVEYALKWVRENKMQYLQARSVAIAAVEQSIREHGKTS
jgi:hypothetical protein